MFLSLRAKGQLHRTACCTVRKLLLQMLVCSPLLVLDIAVVVDFLASALGQLAGGQLGDGIAFRVNDQSALVDFEAAGQVLVLDLFFFRSPIPGPKDILQRMDLRPQNLAEERSADEPASV